MDLHVISVDAGMQNEVEISSASKHGGPEVSKTELPRRRVFFSVAALVLFVVETVLRMPPGDGFFLYLIRILIVCAFLALTGWAPKVGGVGYGVFIALGLVLPPQNAQLSLAIFGVYLVAADWISRNWFVGAMLLFAVVEGAQLSVTPTVPVAVAGLIFGLLIALLGGLALRFNDRHISALNNRARAAEESIVEANRAIRNGIMIDLHDTLATDLVHSALISDNLVSRSTDSQFTAELRLLAETSRASLRHLRALMAEVPNQSSFAASTLADVLNACTVMLRSHEIELEADVRVNVTDALLKVILREASTNVLKHGRVGSRAYVALTKRSGNTVRFVMVNSIGSHGGPRSDPVSCGLGLPNLADRLERAGGRLQFGERGGMWLLIAEYPLQVCSRSDSDSLC